MGEHTSQALDPRGKTGVAREKPHVVIKKSDVRKSDILVPVWVWQCPICYRQVVTHSIDKTLASAKLHLERMHHAEVEVSKE